VPSSARRLIAVLALALLPGCLVAAPKVTVQAHMGVVRAESPHAAHRVAALLDDLAPQVHGLIPDTRERPVEVWVQRQLAIYTHWEVANDVPAFTIEGVGRIHMAEAGPRELSAALGHELVHALLGDSWSTLPAVAEEGLADWVQERLHPHLASSLRADHLAKASAAFDGLALGVWLPASGGAQQVARFTFLGRPEGTDGLPPPSEAISSRGEEGGPFWKPYEVSVSDPRLYGLGYLLVARIVERHGMAGLHALCVKAEREGLAEVPSAWLLDRAGLGDDPSHWRSAIASRFGATELMALGRTLVPFLVELMADELQPRVSARSGDEFLYRYRPRLGLEDGDVRVLLREVPDLRSALRQTWPRDGARPGVVAAAR
jgi:hypothetical protein